MSKDGSFGPEQCAAASLFCHFPGFTCGSASVFLLFIDADIF